jgi:hypothetical protein
LQIAQRPLFGLEAQEHWPSFCCNAANNWFIQLRNEGTGTLTVDPAGSETINGLTTLTLIQATLLLIVTDGTSFYTIGFGQAPSLPLTTRLSTLQELETMSFWCRVKSHCI